MAFQEKSWEEVAIWIRSMGSDFHPFADELAGWQYTGEDILELTKEEYFDGFSSLPESSHKNELWSQIEKMKKGDSHPLKEISLNPQQQRNQNCLTEPLAKEKACVLTAAAKLQPAKSKRIVLQGPSFSTFTASNYIEYRCSTSNSNFNALEGFIDNLRRLKSVGILQAKQSKCCWVIGYASVIEKVLNRAKTYMKDIEIKETGRFLENAFEFELDRKEIFNLSKLEKPFREINSTWSVLLQNKSQTPEWSENGHFTLRVYGSEPSGALNIVSEKIDAGIWGRLARYSRLLSKANLKKCVSLDKIAADHNINIFKFVTEGETICVMMFGKLKDVLNARRSIEQMILSALFPTI